MQQPAQGQQPTEMLRLAGKMEQVVQQPAGVLQPARVQQAVLQRATVPEPEGSPQRVGRQHGPPQSPSRAQPHCQGREPSRSEQRLQPPRPDRSLPPNLAITTSFPVQSPRRALHLNDLQQTLGRSPLQALSMPRPTILPPWPPRSKTPPPSSLL